MSNKTTERKPILHNGETYYWVCFWADGSYYENVNGYLLTDGKGNVDFSSAYALSVKRSRR